MRNKQKIIKQASMDRKWAEIRRYKKRLEDIISNDVPSSPFDLVIFYPCMRLLIEEIDCYQEILETTNKKNKELIKDCSAGGSLLRIYKENINMKIMVGLKATYEEKEQASKELRNSLWGHMTLKREEVMSLLSYYPFRLEEKQIVLLYQCLSTILMELNMRDIEISSICEGY